MAGRLVLCIRRTSPDATPAVLVATRVVGAIGPPWQLSVVRTDADLVVVEAVVDGAAPEAAEPAATQRLLAQVHRLLAERTVWSWRLDSPSAR